jgi:hypothetical protein
MACSYRILSRGVEITQDRSFGNISHKGICYYQIREAEGQDAHSSAPIDPLRLYYFLPVEGHSRCSQRAQGRGLTPHSGAGEGGWEAAPWPVVDFDVDSLKLEADGHGLRIRAGDAVAQHAVGGF